MRFNEKQRFRDRACGRLRVEKENDVMKRLEVPLKAQGQEGPCGKCEEICRTEKEELEKKHKTSSSSYSICGLTDESSTLRALYLERMMSESGLK